MCSQKQNKKNSWFLRLILIVNILAVIALAGSSVSPYVHPDTCVIPALLALFYPVLLLANILFIVFWILKLRYFFIFSLITILAGYSQFFVTFSFNSDKPVGSYDEAMKIVSYNVRLFDQFKWKGNQNFFTRNAVFDFIHSQQADIVCFQEFFHGSEKSFPTIDPFLEKSETKNYHIDYVLTKGDNKHYGLATFTKLPVVGKGSIRFDNSSSNSGIYTDIVFQADTIRVFNFHLESIRFSKADHKFVSEVIDPAAAPQYSSSKIIFQKLSNAIRKRAKQADKVRSYIDKSPYPVIVCGDFNDTPLSYTYRTVSSGLDDAFLETGRGVGASYAGGIPFLRIDFILHDSTLDAYRFEKHKVTFSDHYPLSCYFKMKN
jgi:endonuclease/exonuclease/phosphatase family metal-dependent hydrolase